MQTSTSPTLQPAPLPVPVANMLARLNTELLDRPKLAGDVAELLLELATKPLPLDNVVVCLNENTGVRRGLVVQLTPNQAAILFKLAKACPNVVSLEDLRVAIHGVMGPKSLKNVRMTLNDLRRRIGPLRVSIEIRYGRGYKLELAP